MTVLTCHTVSAEKGLSCWRLLQLSAQFFSNFQSWWAFLAQWVDSTRRGSWLIVWGLTIWLTFELMMERHGQINHMWILLMFWMHWRCVSVKDLNVTHGVQWPVKQSGASAFNISFNKVTNKKTKATASLMFSEWRMKRLLQADLSHKLKALYCTGLCFKIRLSFSAY